jgi:stage III sporulation protein SpoIIIAA
MLEDKMDINQKKTEVVAEHYEVAPCIKAMHMLTAPQGQALDVVRGAPKH